MIIKKPFLDLFELNALCQGGRIAPRRQGQHDNYGAFPIEIDETRRRIEGILLRMDDPGERAYCMQAMKKFLIENALEGDTKF